MTGLFLDRQPEATFLRRIFEDQERPRRNLFVCSPSGFGKTALVDHVLETNTDKRFVRVRIPQCQSRYDEPGYFGRKIATALHKPARYSLQRLIRNQRRRSDRLAVALDQKLALIGILSDVLPYVTSFQNFLRLVRRILLGEDIEEWSESKLRVRLHRFFSRDDTILVIENVQLFDITTLEILSSTLRDLPCYTIVFEYTEIASPPWTRDQIAALLPRANSNTFCIQLNKLPEQFVRRLQAHFDPGKQFHSEFYFEWSGNLIPVTALGGAQIFDLRTDKRESDTALRGALHARLQGLTSIERLLFFLVYVFDGTLRVSKLQYLVKNIDALATCDLQRVLNSLTIADLIVVLDNGEISLRHDSYRDADLTSEYRNEISVSKKNWMQIFHGLVSEKDWGIFESSEIIVMLFRFSSEIGDLPTVVDLFDRIGTLANRSGQPLYYFQILSDAVMPGNQFGLEVPTGRLMSMKKELLYWGYSFRLFEHCLNLAKSWQPKTLTDHILHLGILLGGERYHEAVAKIQDLRATFSEPTLAIWIDLFDLIQQQVIGDQHTARRRWLELLSNDAYKSLDEYGFLLRLGEYFAPLAESVEFLERSQRHFVSRKLAGPAAYSAMSQANLLARLGRFEAAAEQLASCREILESHPQDRQSFYNNKAVIDMLKGSSGLIVERSFHEAFTSYQNEFCKTAILSNHMLYNLESGNSELALEHALSVADRISSGKVKSPRFIERMLDNLTLSQEELNSDDLASQTKRLRKHLSDGLDFQTTHRDITINELENPVDLRASRTDHLVFLVHQIPEIDSLQVRD